MNYQEAQDQLHCTEEELQVLKRKKQDLQGMLDSAKRQKEAFLLAMEQEKRDVDMLQEFSLARIVRKLRGNSEEAYTKEYQEYVEAKMKYDDYTVSLSLLVQENQRLTEQLKTLEAEKARLTHQILTDYPEGQALKEELTQKRSQLHSLRKELVEAVNAVEHVMTLAKKAEESFGKARGWSTYDTFFGGGLLTDVMKYSRIDEANEIVSAISASQSLMMKELQDVDMALGQKLEVISGTEKFFDIAFDNIFSDWSIRGKIDANLDRIDEFIAALQGILLKLNAKLEDVEEELAAS